MAHPPQSDEAIPAQADARVMPQIDLSDEDAVILADLLREAINRDRIFPLPERVIARGKAIPERVEA